MAYNVTNTNLRSSLKHYLDRVRAIFRFDERGVRF